MKQNLAIIPVINKIDLPHANVPLTKQQLEDILAIPADTALLASAKEGLALTRFWKRSCANSIAEADRCAIGAGSLF